MGVPPLQIIELTLNDKPGGEPGRFYRMRNVMSREVMYPKIFGGEALIFALNTLVYRLMKVL